MESEKISCGIYKITSPSGKIYIGKSINIERRFIQYMNLDCKGQMKIYNSLKKYGWYNHKFEIITLCEKSELDNLEVYYIKLFSENTLNIRMPLSEEKQNEYKLRMEKMLRIREEKMEERENKLKERLEVQKKKLEEKEIKLKLQIERSEIKRLKRLEIQADKEKNRSRIDKFGIFMKEMVDKAKIKINLMGIGEQMQDATQEQIDEVSLWMKNESSIWYKKHIIEQ